MRTSYILVLRAQIARAGTKGNEFKKGRMQSEKAKKRHRLVRLWDVMRIKPFISVSAWFCVVPPTVQNGR